MPRFTRCWRSDAVLLRRRRVPGPKGPGTRLSELARRCVDRRQPREKNTGGIVAPSGLQAADRYADIDKLISRVPVTSLSRFSGALQARKRGNESTVWSCRDFVGSNRDGGSDPGPLATVHHAPVIPAPSKRHPRQMSVGL
jgi:hypothetical protein